MNFYKIDDSTIGFDIFLRYMGTLLVVTFPHPYCNIMLIKFGEVDWYQYPSHHDWKGDLLGSQPLGRSLAIQFRDTFVKHFNLH